MAKNVSNQFKNIIKNGGPFYAYAAVTFADGSQTIMNSKTDFMATGNGYSESSEAGFPLGVAISKTITLNIDNTTAYESIQDTEGRHIQDTTGEDILANKKSVEEDYYNARIVLYTEADLPDGTQERIQEGIFTVIDSVRPDEVLEITAYDDMYKADVAFYSSLTYPVSVQMLLNEVCNFCDITLGSATFKNNDYQIHQAPQNLTARQVIGYIAQIAGGNAVIDRNGRLVIKSYDLSGFDASEEISSDEIESESGIHIFSRFTSAPDIGVADVIITGVSTEVEDENGEDEVYLVGTEEYAISVDNPLITGNEQDAVNRIAESIMGLRLRPFSGNFLPDPTVEFMDLCYVIDRKDNIYKSFVTLHDFDYLGGSMFANETESPQKFGGTYYSEAAQAYQKAKEDIKNNKKQWEQAIENLSQQVANSSGLYTTKEEQPDGSTIFYMHNKPTLEESDIVWKMTAETLTVSTDGGKTWNAGITVNGEVIARIMNTIGINFDWGVGGTLILQDADGNVTAYMDADTGEVRLTVTELSIQGKNVNEIAADEIEEFVDTIYGPEIEDLKNQIDQKSETWYQSTDPSLEWDETEETALQDTTGADILDTNGEQIIGILEIGKTVHEGDLWKDSDTNVEYIYQDGQWIEMPIPDAVFDEIDGKAQIYVNTPVPPYNVGDLWFNSSTSDIMTCINARSTGSYTASDWQKRNKYTDDSALNNFIENEFSETIDEISNQIDGKAETWYQSTDPSSSWTTTALKNEHVGDIWYNTTSSVQKSYRWDGTSWQEMKTTPPDEVFDQIDGKAQVFVTTPTPPYNIGDLWVQGITGDIMRCKTARQSGAYVSTDWELASKYTDDTAVDDLDTALDQEGVFNRLTNGGTTQGIYLSGGKIYINATYIGSGTISASRIAAGSITASKLSISDLYALGATIAGWDIRSSYLESSKGDITLYSDGRIKIGGCTLSANSKALKIGYGAHIYNDPNVFSDGSGYFKIFNLSHVTSGGHLVFASDGATVAYLSSSSKRYKNHVSDVSDEEALKILDIPVIKFKYKDGYLFPTDFLVDKEIPGFYAEDVEEVNPILCQYNEDGSVEDWNYRTMIPYMVKTMQIQQKRIDNLQTQINELKTMILNMKGA